MSAPGASAGALTAQELDKMLHQYANTARKTSTQSSLYLSQPIPHSEAAAQAIRFTPLAAWGIFNPFGPTVTSLFLIEVPTSQEQLLFLRMLHPFSPFAVIYGLLPKQVAQDEGQLRKTLQRLFEINGSKEYPLMNDLPSLIKEIKESPISVTVLKELFFHVAVSLRGQNLGETCDLLKKFKGDPWGRAKLEFSSALKRERPRQAGILNTVTRPQYEEWWSLVTDPAHVAIEEKELRRAWEGAIKFQERLRR